MSSHFRTTKPARLPTHTGTITLQEDEIDDRPWGGKGPVSRPWGTGFPGHAKWSLPEAYKAAFSAINVRCTLAPEEVSETLAYCLESTLDFDHAAWKAAWPEASALLARVAQVHPVPGRVFGMKAVMLGGAESVRPRYTGTGMLLGYMGVICGKDSFSPVETSAGSEEIVFSSPVECARYALVQAGGPVLPHRMTQFKLHWQGWLETTLSPAEARRELGLPPVPEVEL